MRPRFMNRGSAQLDEDRTAPNCASMRPRFMNRGSDSEGVDGIVGQLGFNEAPIHESGKWIGHDVSLSQRAMLQ